VRNSASTFSLLPGARASRTLLLAIAVVSCVYLSIGLRSFRAEQFAHSGTLDDLIHATRLGPDNATSWQRLGLARLYQQNDPEAALSDLQRALQLSPRDADSWIGAAYAFQFLGRLDEERVAVSRALEAEPRRPEIAWQAANLYAVLGDREPMTKQICTVLEHDRARSDAALDLARKITGRKTLDCGHQENAN
jgi:tetratricopeptide (TPR) repeat protein